MNKYTELFNKLVRDSENIVRYTLFSSKEKKVTFEKPIIIYRFSGEEEMAEGACLEYNPMSPIVVMNLSKGRKIWFNYIRGDSMLRVADEMLKIIGG